MSFDLAVWKTKHPLAEDEAAKLYASLCEGDPSFAESLLLESPSIQSFYDELYSLHPEIDDIPEDRIDDHDYCPWSCAHDRSDRHIIMACVWSQADNVHNLVNSLAKKHNLSVYDPQNETGCDPQTQSANKPWWRFW